MVISDRPRPLLFKHVITVMTCYRLNVVMSPLRREEVCKPTMLPDGRTVYRCTYCNKDFTTLSDINRHMDFHEGEYTGEKAHGSYVPSHKFYFFRILSHVYMEWMCLMRRLQLARSCTSSPDNSLSDKSFLMLSNHLHCTFELPLSSFPPAPPSLSLSCQHILLPFSIHVYT